MAELLDQLLALSRSNWDLNLDQLKELAKAHWKKHLPKFYRNLKKSGELEKRAENAAKFTLDAFNLEKEKLLKKGWRPQEASEVAWEMVREEWVLLRSEEQEKEFDPISAGC